MRIALTLISLGGLLLAGGLAVAAPAANPRVVMKTSKGDITLELFADKAPLTVKNFLTYVDKDFYDGTIFHRVIKDFMIQGGGLTADLHEKAALAPIKNEAGNGLSNKRGTIAMARTSVVDSATCQFFINTVDNSFLDHKDNTSEGFGYCVFGKVIAGLETVDAIAAVPTMTRRGMGDVPRETVTIISVRRVTD
jgi:cyclophilin family peptidyl-prolyl cis-trans isomerase